MSPLLSPKPENKCSDVSLILVYLRKYPQRVEQAFILVVLWSMTWYMNRFTDYRLFVHR